MFNASPFPVPRPFRVRRKGPALGRPTAAHWMAVPHQGQKGYAQNPKKLAARSLPRFARHSRKSTSQLIRPKTVRFYTGKVKGNTGHRSLRIWSWRRRYRSCVAPLDTGRCPSCRTHGCARPLDHGGWSAPHAGPQAPQSPEIRRFRGRKPVKSLEVRDDLRKSDYTLAPSRRC